MTRSSQDPATSETHHERVLRLWILNHYGALPSQSAGTRHYDLAVRMRRRGVATTIFAAGFSHSTLREEKLGRRQLRRIEMVDGIRFVWVRTLRYRTNGLLRLLNMISYMGAVLVAQIGAGTPDVVIGSSVHPFAALAARLIALGRRVPFVYEIRDLWPQTLIDMGAIPERGVVAWVMRRIERVLVRDAAAVVSLLPGIDEYFRERGLHPRRLAYIPNGAPGAASLPQAMPPPDLAATLRRWRADGVVLFGYVGAHGAVNGLDTLLGAASQLQAAGETRCRIVLVGDGREKPGLMSMARRLGLTNVTFHAPVAKAAVAQLLSLFDVGLVHVRENAVYRYGTSFNKLLDYMANGLPVVSACKTAYDPVARAEAGISIDPEDSSALAEAMVTMASLPTDDRAAMGARGRDYISREHDLDKLAAQLEALVIDLRAGVERAAN
jgi:glycosyltransferase involved in cell wall biosynthesis